MESGEREQDDVSPASTGMHTRVMIPKWQDKVAFLSLFFAMLIPSAILLYVVLETWIEVPSQRAWLILGFGFYIASALKMVTSRFVHIFERMFYLRVEVHRLTSPTMFEALTHAIETECEKQGKSCSRDNEARQEHDRVTGNVAVKFRFWSSASHSVKLLIDVNPEGRDQGVDTYGSLIPHRIVGGLHVHVRYLPGETITTGRHNSHERCEVLVFFVRCSSGEALARKRRLCKWMENCYNDWVSPLDGVVGVYALQESSTDWVPTWALENNKRVKCASGLGHSFFLEREALKRIHADAKIWSASELRVYLVTGPPGVGKSEFTIWLAAQLGLPVYRLCLSSHKLTDDRLAQLLSPISISHNSILIQVDEFQQVLQGWMQSKNLPESSNSGVTAGGFCECLQQVLQRWMRSKNLPGSSNSGVTAGGFCECLQGSMAMGKGIVLITGTNEIVAERVKKWLPAVFRRIHVEAPLDYMNKEDISKFFRSFLARFVPSCSPSEWNAWENRFLDEGGPWAGSIAISVDMLKQFFMRQITEASCLGIGEFVALEQPGVKEYQVRSHNHRAEFLRMICDVDAAYLFLDQYAPVRIEPSPLI